MEIDSYQNPDAEALLLTREERLIRERRQRREVATNWMFAAGFVTAAVLVAVLAPWQRSLSLSHLGLIAVVWLVVERVKFPAAAGWTHPTMLAFVPALFVLPTPVVPLIAMVVTVLRRAPDFARGRTRPAMVPVLLGEPWYAIGPTLVIVLAGAQRFAWSHWPIYVLALLAQVLFDLTFAIGRDWIAEGIRPRVQIPLLVWVYAADAVLAPLGLVIAAVSIGRPGLMLLTLPVVALLYVFARERQQRLDAILELSTAYRGTTLLLGDIIEADDSYTGVHSREVVDLSLGVADALGLDATRKRNVEFGALLHDVGKIRVPKEILNKQRPLDPLEWEFIRRHTIEGEAMLRQVGGRLADLAPIVRASHERWDGGGYPDGLAAEQIPIEARIISACDAYNAMTTDRPYRSAMRRSKALAELRRGSGSQFDPQVVQALVGRIRAEVEAELKHSHGYEIEVPLPDSAPREPRHRGYTAVSARL